MYKPHIGILLFEFLLIFPLLFSLLSLAGMLAYQGHHLFYLLKAYSAIHENARITQTILRKEIKTGRNTQKKIYLAARRGTSKQVHTSLYLKIGEQQAHEIIENVETLKIQPQGTLVHCFLLLTSQKEVLKKPMSYYFLGQQKLAKDKRLYLPLHLAINIE